VLDVYDLKSQLRTNCLGKGSTCGNRRNQ